MVAVSMSPLLIFGALAILTIVSSSPLPPNPSLSSRYSLYSASRPVADYSDLEDFRRSSSSQSVRKIVRYATKMMDCTGVQSPGFLAIGVHENRTLFAESLGKASLNPSKTATPSTLWPIGSITKSITAVLIGRLVDEGLLQWNSLIKDLIPGFSFGNVVSDSLTVRDLLSMQMGIPRNDVAWLVGAVGNISHVLSEFKTLGSISPIRQTFWYNSFGYVILGRVYELLKNESWSSGIRNKIFLPLGMTSSSATLADALSSGRYAYPHLLSASSLEAVNVKPFSIGSVTVDQVAASGSISLTAGDAAKYLKALLSPTMSGLLSVSSYNFLHKAGVMSLAMHDGVPVGTDINFISDLYNPVQFQLFSYGGGWLQGTYRNRKVIAHNGGTLGQSAWLFVFPEDKLSFLLASNMDSLSGMSQYMWDWALYARDMIVGEENDKVRTSSICNRFNIKNGGPSLAYVDDSYISDYLLTSNFSSSYIDSIVGLYRNSFYGYVNVTRNGNDGAFFSFGNLSGKLMTGPYTGVGLFSSPSFYQVELLGAGFGMIDPISGKAMQLKMGVSEVDPVFFRVM